MRSDGCRRVSVVWRLTLPASAGCRGLPASVGCQALPASAGCQALPASAGCQAFLSAKGTSSPASSAACLNSGCYVVAWAKLMQRAGGYSSLILISQTHSPLLHTWPLGFKVSRLAAKGNRASEATHVELCHNPVGFTWTAPNCLNMTFVKKNTHSAHGSHTCTATSETMNPQDSPNHLTAHEMQQVRNPQHGQAQTV